MFSKFNEESRKVLTIAKKEMLLLKHAYIGSEHIVLAILKNKNYNVCKILNKNGIDYDGFKKELLNNEITKKVKNCEAGKLGVKEKYADIDMRSIKYFCSKNDINCNLYSQNIQDEDVIKKLDDFFMECNTGNIFFCIIPDSYDYMMSLGYECVSKRYVVDYE